MGKGFFDIPEPKTFAKQVSFLHCTDALQKEKHRKKLFSDNVIFLNSAAALLTDLDTPFLEQKDFENYKNYISSNRPEIKDRIKTLEYIRDNREKWFEDGSIQIKLKNIAALGAYLRQDKSRLLARSAEYLNLDLDVNYAVKQVITNPNFNMNDVNNPVRIAWDNLKKRLDKVFQPQDLFAR